MALSDMDAKQISELVDHKFLAMQFGGGVRLSLYRRLISLLAYGVPLMKVMEQMLHAYAKRKLDKQVGARVLGIIYQEMRQATGGVVFADALRNWAPDAEVMLINAGERSGDIERGLQEAVFVNESLSRIKSAVIGAVSYPMVLFFILMGLYMLFALMILPKIESLMPVDQWPPLSQHMHTVLTIIRVYGLYILVVVAGALAAVLFSMPYFTGPVRNVLDRYYPYSIYRVIAGSGFLVGLSAMLEAGVKMRDALEQLRGNANPYVTWHINKILQSLSRGESSGSALDTGMFNDETSISLEIFGDSGAFEESMKLLGREAVENTVSWIKAVGQVLTTSGVVAIGGSLVFLLGGFYQLIQEVKNMAG